MFCGACARDITLVRGLIARGHDVEVIPLYTPLRTEGSPVPQAPIFYGGVNVYLQQLARVFGRLPFGLNRWLDRPNLLNWVGQFAVSTNPRELGAMTVSVLAGAEGQQVHELDNLLAYLKTDGVRPDILGISNTLLSAIAPPAKKALGIPIVTSWLGEDTFVEALRDPYRQQARGWMRRNVRSVDLVVATGEAYAESAIIYLQADLERLQVIHAGVDTDTYRPVGPRPRDPFTIGYLSVINPAKGLDLLVHAFIELVRDRKRDARLRIAGKVLDASFWHGIKLDIERAGLQDRVDVLGEVDTDGKMDFLRGISVFVQPSRQHEARAMAALEAQACGVPLIAPSRGVFPEMLNLTKGGILVPKADEHAITDALESLMDNPDDADVWGQSARAGVVEHYGAPRQAEEMEAAYEALLGKVPA